MNSTKAFLRFAGGIMVGLICCAPIWAEPPAAVKAPPPATKQAEPTLTDFVRQNSGRFAYGLYVGARKVGWTVDDMRLGKWDGREVAVVHSEGRMEMMFMGTKASFVWNQRSYYDFAGEGQVLRIDETSREDDRTTKTLAQRRGTQLDIQTDVAGHATQRQTPLPKQTLRQMQKLDSWLKTVDRVGDEFRSFSTALDTKDIDRLEVYQFRGRRPARWGGVDTELIHVQMTVDGAIFEMDVLPNGNVVKGKLGPFDMRLEEEAVAKNSDAVVVDMTFEVPVAQALGDPRHVDALTLELSDVGDTRIPQNRTQRVTERREGKVVVQITRKPAAAEPKPLSAAEKEALLSATPSVQCDEKKIRDLAAEIVGAAADPRAKAERINRWVHEHLKKTYQANATTSLQVLENRAGDCSEHTLLFVALCRAAGVPARELGGLAYDESQVVHAAGQRPKPRGTFNWHAWAEIHDGRHWVSMDPTWDEVEVDATHLVLSVGSEDFAWLNILGKMKMRVLSAGTR